jgi:endonuclease G
MNARSSASLPIAFAATLIFSAIGSPPKTQPHARPAVYTCYQPNQARTAFEKKCVAENCKFGLPAHRPNAPLGPTRLVFRGGYVLEHSSELRIPFWVCEHVSQNDLKGRVNQRLKPEPFRPDPELEHWPHAELTDYKKSRFARGHMAPDADRTQSKAAKTETYFLSNMVPQAGQKFNSSIWLQLEKKVRAWAEARKECWIVTGVLLHDPKEEKPATANGLVEYFTIGQSPVGVPTHLFKIILAKKPDQGNDAYEALAFVFENESYGAGRSLEDFLCSVDYIEERAGFDLFPGLPKNQANEIRHKQATVLWP